ncbi:hypothetical protein HMPREF2609_04795 [Rothia sp. HMSC058E10]|jgi:hypothetical protein|uniref:class I SAM-dependent methyltransferase n=1 Tax=unclassified Rothia (in: high G+C Gram-positive bacteria) TaxID=2689056 RepID=UPI0008A63D51|nr:MULTISPECIES: class I SAM-dependent methyltransferase [unclassified Rothia (in: high G+C Gram-positive bacteria)]OFK71396.1 hypothetical protein HMPREF2804_02910 [Rothia sp. HMSC065G12]OFN17989.1 hypothetical protein HMPREF2609_04795 [Rothia sp. HMSC058E10]
MNKAQRVTSASDWYVNESLRHIARGHDKPYDLRYSKMVACEVSRMKPFRLIDIGCGYGELFKALYYRDIPVTYIGFDPDKKCIESLQELHSKQCKAHLGDSESAIDYVQNTHVDVVTSVLSLGLWNDPVGDLIKVAHALPPGGQIIAVDLLKLCEIPYPLNAAPLSRYKIDQYNSSLAESDINILCEDLSATCESEIKWFVDIGLEPQEIDYNSIQNQKPFTTLFFIRITRKELNVG